MVSDRCEATTTLLRFFWRWFREESEAVTIHTMCLYGDFCCCFCCSLSLLVCALMMMMMMNNNDNEKQEKKEGEENIDDEIYRAKQQNSKTIL